MWSPWLHWRIGGVFMIGFLTVLVGLVLMAVLRVVTPAFFRGETLTRETETLVPDTF